MPAGSPLPGYWEGYCDGLINFLIKILYSFFIKSSCLHDCKIAAVHIVRCGSCPRSKRDHLILRQAYTGKMHGLTVVGKRSLCRSVGGIIDVKLRSVCSACGRTVARPVDIIRSCCGNGKALPRNR